MQVNLTIMYQDLEKYNQGQEIQAASASRNGYPDIVLEDFDGDTVEVLVDTSEIVRREEVVEYGMIRGTFHRYIIKKLKSGLGD